MKNVNDSRKWDLYYDAMDELNEGYPIEAIQLLKESLKIDRDFVAAHVGLAEAYKMMGDEDREVKHVDLGYEKTIKKFGKLPDKLNWGKIEDRQYFRAICKKAEFVYYDEKIDEAEKLYRSLLKCDPQDHIGARFYLAGLFAGLLPLEIDHLFDKCNESQDWYELKILLKEQNEKHKFFTCPEEEEEEFFDDYDQEDYLDNNNDDNQNEENNNRRH